LHVPVSHLCFTSNTASTVYMDASSNYFVLGTEPTDLLLQTSMFSSRMSISTSGDATPHPPNFDGLRPEQFSGLGLTGALAQGRRVCITTELAATQPCSILQGPSRTMQVLQTFFSFALLRTWEGSRASLMLLPWVNLLLKLAVMSPCVLYLLHYITFIQRTGMCSQSCKLTSAVRIRTTTKKSYPYISFKPNMSIYASICFNSHLPF
jgi:hypothetical protein